MHLTPRLPPALGLAIIAIKTVALALIVGPQYAESPNHCQTCVAELDAKKD
jgi:hypothetical protein